MFFTKKIFFGAYLVHVVSYNRLKIITNKGETIMPKIKINDVKKIIDNLLNTARDDSNDNTKRMDALAEAYAYWFILNEANIPYRDVNNASRRNNAYENNARDQQEVNIDQREALNMKKWALESDAFKIAERKGTVNELTGLSINRVGTRINEVNENINFFNAGDAKAVRRARKIFNQFSNTWRIKWNSSEFDAAKQAMQDIAESQTHPNQLDNYVAAETVKRYVSKNLNKAKSAVGITRMSCALAFLKQTMSPESFKAYCANLNGLRGIHPQLIVENGNEYDRSNPRCIVPDEIGTIEEVYKNARERLTRYAHNENIEIDTRDIAILTALKNIERSNPADGKNKIVEHETLQAEIARIQNNREFRNLCRTTPRDELIMMAWEHNFDTTMTPVLNDEQKSRVAKERQDKENSIALEKAQKDYENAKNQAIKILKEEEVKEAERKRIEEENRKKEEEKRKKEEEEERRKIERTMFELCVELSSELEEFAEPAKLKEEESRKNKSGSLEGIFDILNDQKPTQKKTALLNDLFDQLNDDYIDPMDKKVEVLAKFAVIGRIYNENRNKKDRNITIKLADFKEEVDKLKKNTVFINYAKKTIEDPEFSQNIWNIMKKSKKPDYSEEFKKSYSVMSYSLLLDTEYEKYVNYSQNRSMDYFYDMLSEPINSYMKLFSHDDKKLKRIVVTSLALREMERELGPDGKASQYEFIARSKKYINDPAVQKTMQSIKGISIDTELRKGYGKKDFPKFFGKVVEEAYSKAVTDLNKTKESKKIAKP